MVISVARSPSNKEDRRKDEMISDFNTQGGNNVVHHGDMLSCMPARTVAPNGISSWGRNMARRRGKWGFGGRWWSNWVRQHSRTTWTGHQCHGYASKSTTGLRRHPAALSLTSQNLVSRLIHLVIVCSSFTFFIPLHHALRVPFCKLHNS